MNPMQRDVAAFNEAVATPRGTFPELRAAELRARLIMEEALETVIGLVGEREAFRILDDVDAKTSRKLANKERAGAPPDMVEAVDGLCDLLYVTFGAFDALGIDAEPLFAIVHEANMTKLTGPVDEHGKRLKPPGFVPPQEKLITALLAMGWSGE